MVVHEERPCPEKQMTTDVGDLPRIGQPNFPGRPRGPPEQIESIRRLADIP